MLFEGLWQACPVVAGIHRGKSLEYLLEEEKRCSDEAPDWRIDGLNAPRELVIGGLQWVFSQNSKESVKYLFS